MSKSNLSNSEKRAQLKTQYLKTVGLIEKIENEEKPIYQTAAKYLPKVGYIHELESFPAIVKAQKIINSENEDNSAVAKDLGLNEEELEIEEVKLMGFKLSVWNGDIQKRITELRSEIKLKKLKSDAKKLKKFLSDDDIFDLEMDKLTTVDWEEGEEKEEEMVAKN